MGIVADPSSCERSQQKPAAQVLETSFSRLKSDEIVTPSTRTMIAGSDSIVSRAARP